MLCGLGEGARRQAEKLLAEGVEVEEDEMGVFRVPKRYQWEEVEGKTLEDLLGDEE